MASDVDEKWRKKLTQAALRGAVAVVFEWTRTGEGTSFALRSRDSAGQPISDDSDYDLLKARIVPLEALAEAEGFGPLGEARSVWLDLVSGQLVRDF
jgi:hypothetical protein